MWKVAAYGVLEPWETIENNPTTDTLFALCLEWMEEFGVWIMWRIYP